MTAERDLPDGYWIGLALVFGTSGFLVGLVVGVLATLVIVWL